MFNFQSHPIRPMFIKTDENAYIRVDLIEKIRVEWDVEEDDQQKHHDMFKVMAEVKDTFDTVLFIGSTEAEAEKWMDDLVVRLNGLA